MGVSPLSNAQDFYERFHRLATFGRGAADLRGLQPPDPDLRCIYIVLPRGSFAGEDGMFRNDKDSAPDPQTPGETVS